ncbi:MAG: hypothetical protein CVU11_05590 [Bacteroidetes bacterium HGW-Bacteroidetes-6]|jgi:hypothetical protein|nr:MAG: hypothetical protein CVU11_05590 [Bacteroidetes bacterium HGW-Bacteroidetes-6]
MKKMYSWFSSVLFLTAIVSMLFVSCEKDEDTETPEPKTGFFSGVINLNNKSITPGVNGYLSEPYDTCFSDANGDHFSTGIRYFQASSGYYISSREVVSFELVNLFDTLSLNKDSLFHAVMSSASLPFYTPGLVLDSTYHTGVKINWRSSDGQWWTSANGAQSGNITIDTTRNTTILGSLSSHQVYVSFDCTLYKMDGSSGSLGVTNAKGRFTLSNTCFY